MNNKTHLFEDTENIVFEKRKPYSTDQKGRIHYTNKCETKTTAGKYQVANKFELSSHSFIFISSIIW